MRTALKASFQLHRAAKSLMIFLALADNTHILYAPKYRRAVAPICLDPRDDQANVPIPTQCPTRSRRRQ